MRAKPLEGILLLLEYVFMIYVVGCPGLVQLYLNPAAPISVQPSDYIQQHSLKIKLLI